MKRLYAVFASFALFASFAFLLPAHLTAQGGPGTIATFAGTGSRVFLGDGGSATQAGLWGATGVAVDVKGNVYIADSSDNRIRQVRPDGIITTFAGTGPTGINVRGDFSGDGGPATQAQLNYPTGVAVDEKGNVYIADRGNNRIRRVRSDGMITTIVGLFGDGGPAIQAKLLSPYR